MRLDLTKLKTMHPRMSSRMADEYNRKVAVGFNWAGRRPGTSFETRFDLEEKVAEVSWRDDIEEDGAHDDRNRVTEDAAEALALAFVHVSQGWTTQRRLQRGEFADWLLHKDERLMALEVSGIGVGRDPSRLAEKLEQVSRAKSFKIRVACVVDFPSARIDTETALETP